MLPREPRSLQRTGSASKIVALIIRGRLNETKISIPEEASELARGTRCANRNREIAIGGYAGVISLGVDFNSTAQSVAITPSSLGPWVRI